MPESATQAPSKYPGQKPFTIPYDKLVIAVGCYSQTFNTPGVKEHAFFLKDVKGEFLAGPASEGVDGSRVAARRR